MKNYYKFNIVKFLMSTLFLQQYKEQQLTSLFDESASFSCSGSCSRPDTGLDLEAIRVLSIHSS